MNLLLAEVARATLRLAEAGVASPRHDAEELAAYVHGVRRGELHSVPDQEFDARFWEAIARRAAREPLQHITGRAYFRYVEVAVGPGVFVPRAETEVLVEWAVERLRALDAVDPLVVDLGTGSGAIALSIVREVPRARVHAVEVEPEAYAWAGRNLAGSTVTLHEGDIADVLPEFDGAVDLVISNPPYIPLGEWEHVEAEVRDYDPQIALWSGQDGLDAIRVIERTAHRLLKPGGHVVAEHSNQQGYEAPGVFHTTGRWGDIADHRDLAGRDRFVTARKEETRP